MVVVTYYREAIVNNHPPLIKEEKVVWLRETMEGRRYMEGMGVKFTTGIGGRLLRHSGVFGPMAGTSGTHS